MNSMQPSGTYARTSPLAAAALVALGCGSNPSLATPADQDAAADASTTWVCDSQHDDWERCAEERVQYCHVLDGMEPHFHWGADCASLGLSCTQIEPGKAACVDRSTKCAASDVRCDQNAVVFCADGWVARTPCGTSKECVEHDGPPRCVDKSGTEQSACEVFAGKAASENAVADFASFPDAHVDPGKLYEIQLPQGSAGYVHFPVTATGDYYLYLAGKGFFDAFEHRGGTDVVPAASGGTPHESCAALIGDQWHSTLVYDGPGAGEPVPYVVRFKAMPDGGAVKIMIQSKGNER